jgi:hypothetical protein
MRNAGGWAVTAITAARAALVAWLLKQAGN